MTRLATAAAALALSASPALAAEEFAFDHSHTHVLFFVDHLGFSTTQGEFMEFDGTLMLDTEAPENSSVTVTIDAASIDTGYADRDEHLRTGDFFNVEEHPELTFTSTDVAVTGENTAEVTGDLTILGVTQPVTLNVTLNAIGPHPFNGATVAGFSATTTISRSDFGMDFGVPAIGDEIEIRIESEASPVGS